MKLMTEACTKKARTGWRRRTWWDEHEGEDELVVTDAPDSRETLKNEETKLVRQ